MRYLVLGTWYVMECYYDYIWCVILLVRPRKKKVWGSMTIKMVCVYVHAGLHVVRTYVRTYYVPRYQVVRRYLVPGSNCYY